MRSDPVDPNITFKCPPVIEVVCGAQFEPINELSSPHLGVLWTKFQPDYPYCKELLPLTPVIERFDAPPPSDSTMEFFEGLPMPRVWFISSNETEIIQVQKDRFLFNWKKTSSEQDYPRYHHVFSSFEKKLRNFAEFLNESSLGDLIPTQYEITYINQISQENGWSSLADLGNIFPDLQWQKRHQYLAEPETVNFNLSFLLPDNNGRLRVGIQSAKRIVDDAPILQFSLTARGIGSCTRIDMMKPWFDLGRSSIVKAFTDLTDSEVQRDKWELQ